MKLWYGYGSEHSMNLVMIGHFKEANDANKAKQMIDRLTEQVNGDVEAELMQIGGKTDRFTKGMLELLTELNLMTIGAVEMEQFAYETTIEVKGDQVVIKTEESDVSAFLKVLVDMGARVEVYSAHDYPDTGYGRGGK